MTELEELSKTNLSGKIAFQALFNLIGILFGAFVRT